MNSTNFIKFSEMFFSKVFFESFVGFIFEEILVGFIFFVYGATNVFEAFRYRSDVVDTEATLKAFLKNLALFLIFFCVWISFCPLFGKIDKEFLRHNF